MTERGVRKMGNHHLADKLAHVSSSVVSAFLMMLILPAIGVLAGVFWSHSNEPGHGVVVSQIEQVRADQGRMRQIEEDAETEREQVRADVATMAIELARIRTILEERLPPRQ